MQAYHGSVTTAVTAFNPFLPAIGRVYQVLLDAAPAGQMIETNNRALAEAAQCSAGTIPGILRDLERLEYIERVTGPRGSLIQVVERSGMVDRSFSASGCDQESDRLGATPMSDQESDRSNPVLTPDRSPGRTNERSVMTDPPHTPLYGKTLLAAADSVAALDQVPLGGCGGMPIAAADRWPDRADVAARLESEELNCEFPDEILEKRPELTLDKLNEQWAIAQQREEAGRADNARDLLFGTLRKGPGHWLHGRAPRPAVDWGAYAEAQSAAAAQPPPAPLDDFDQALERARQLAPDADPDELNILAADLVEGVSEAAVLEWLAGERARRAYLEQRGKVRYAA